MNEHMNDVMFFFADDDETLTFARCIVHLIVGLCWVVSVTLNIVEQWCDLCRDKWRESSQLFGN
jgi:hypothetical protein